MSLKRSVTHIFIWTLLPTLPPPGGIRQTVESSMRTALCRSWNGRLAVHGRMSKQGLAIQDGKFTLKWKPLLYTNILKWIFLLSWCLIKIPPRFTESRFQPTSQTSHRRQIGNEFTQGIGGRQAGFGEFWRTWGIEHIRNDEDREEWLSTNWLLKVFFWVLHVSFVSVERIMIFVTCVVFA